MSARHGVEFEVRSPHERQARTMKCVLMIAYHFPPLAGSSGVQRTLRFVQHLPQFGWQPLVLSAQPRAYERVADDLQEEVPRDTIVRRAFALDTGRHLALRGRYPAWLARPDRWVSWKFDGIRQGMRLISKFKPQAIWSTYPIATAHVIGRELHRRSGIPWVADFRDPMAQEGYPSDPLTWSHYRAIEKDAVRLAACSVFTTPGAARMYRARYPDAAQRIVVLENGYDEDSFAAAERANPTAAPLNAGAITLLHSGIVYPSERDPTHLFDALRRLAQRGAITPGRLRLRFRAAVSDDLLRRLAAEFEITDFIEVRPPLAYREALQEMLRADALLVMQGANCNEQIPAKIYEYLRARRPTLSLADPQGDTAAALRGAGLDAFAPLESAECIAKILPAFLDAVGERRSKLPDMDAVRRASRMCGTQLLANWLDALAPATPCATPHGTLRADKLAQ
jgi:glycosyltransferase involved in cell wall biosynthesis